MLSNEGLLALAKAKMPFGKYSGRYLVDVPEEYFLWFERKGFPQNKLGEQMALMLELKRQGADHVLRPLVDR
ncbi:DUF3820 family protein [Thaumasiovibrio subtropicus]|uniref:DUF3820 family protein n=1 Tax=Thaumasiovibrio subtropicus TaxID=1891207 RepID=UPI000B354D7B|nr:DUF3820 family protein [Thaumasiovibrio subtropicus]